MKKEAIILFFAIVLLPLICSANIQADYQIFSNKVFVEVSYDNIQNFTYTLPLDYQTLEITTEDYTIKDNVLMINPLSGSFSYITKFYIDKSLNKNYFILNNPFNQKSDVLVYLEEGYILPESNNILIPEPTEVTSDGRRVILKWDNFENDEIVFKYQSTNNISVTTKLMFVLLIIIILLLTFKYFLSIKKTKKQQSTKNLYEDEKKIVMYLQNKKDNESWTKEMIRELNISKVKLSRKLRSLEQKGLIKKIPYGNENKIILVE